MKVYRSLEELPVFHHAVVTIGTFDGVHNGHQAIIRSIVAEAKKWQGESVIITFHPHPRNIIQPERSMHCLSTVQEKLDILETLSVDHVVVVPFNREFSELSATAYVEDFLIARFQPKVIVIGYDHRFGRDRNGDINLLKELALQHGIQVDEISKQEVEHITISSTRIRQALATGEVSLANSLLGYPYHFSGIVVRGDGIGKQLGYPTANLYSDDESKLIPGNGIYVVRVSTSKQKEPIAGMMSIGTRPTFDGTDRRIEVNLFDFSKDIYGDVLTVQVLDYIRGEEKFPDSQALIAAMAEDEKISRKRLANL